MSPSITTPFDQLNPDDKSKLIKAPVYVSLLAANADIDQDESRKRDAIKMAHIRTFTADPPLRGFYLEAEKVFLKNLEEINHSLPEDPPEREKQLRAELEKLNPILMKLGENYASRWRKSLNSYAGHVAKAHGNLAVSAMLPLYLKIFES